MASKTVKVFEILYDGAGSGPAGDGTFVKRFGPKDKAAAERFAAEHTYYGKPTKVIETDARRELARRWGVV